MADARTKDRLAKAREAREKVDPNESKSDRFRRLANKRVPSAIRAIKSVENLSGPGYESTPEQRDKIVSALTAAVERMAQSYSDTKQTEEAFTV